MTKCTANGVDVPIHKLWGVIPGRIGLIVELDIENGLVMSPRYLIRLKRNVTVEFSGC